MFGTGKFLAPADHARDPGVFAETGDEEDRAAPRFVEEGELNIEKEPAPPAVRSPAPGWQLVLVLVAGLAAMAVFVAFGWGGLAIIISCYAAVGAVLLAWLRWGRRHHRTAR